MVCNTLAAYRAWLSNLECWSLLQLSGAELALREATHDVEHAGRQSSQISLHGSKLPAESWSKLLHSKFAASSCCNA
jgi:hypothetical protein